MPELNEAVELELVVNRSSLIWTSLATRWFGSALWWCLAEMVCPWPGATMDGAIWVQTSPEKSSPTIAGVSQLRSLRAATSTRSPVEAGPEECSLPTVGGVEHCSAATKTGQTEERTAYRSSRKTSAEIVAEGIHST